jgi:hypothetical protein
LSDEFNTLEAFAGKDSAVVIWKLGHSIGVDMLTYAENGHIATHHDTATPCSGLGE